MKGRGLRIRSATPPSAPADHARHVAGCLSRAIAFFHAHIVACRVLGARAYMWCQRLEVETKRLTEQRDRAESERDKSASRAATAEQDATETRKAMAEQQATAAQAALEAESSYSEALSRVREELETALTERNALQARATELDSKVAELTSQVEAAHGKVCWTSLCPVLHVCVCVGCGHV